LPPGHHVRVNKLLKPYAVAVAVADRAARQQTRVREGSVRQQLS
jgi:hypothetical protein